MALAPSGYKFYYFNAIGRGEAIRMLLAAARVQYEDITWEFDDWPKYKPLATFGQVPMLETEGRKICQSLAILKYLAKKHGFYGNTLLEDAQVDMIAHTIDDVRQQFRNIVLEPNEEQKKVLKEKYEKEQLPDWYAKFEKYLAENNPDQDCFVGKKLSYPDLMFACYIAEPRPFKNVLGIDIDLSSYPRLLRLVENVKSNPAIAEFLSKRTHLVR